MKKFNRILLFFCIVFLVLNYFTVCFSKTNTDLPDTIFVYQDGDVTNSYAVGGISDNLINNYDWNKSFLFFRNGRQTPTFFACPLNSVSNVEGSITIDTYGYVYNNTNINFDILSYTKSTGVWFVDKTLSAGAKSEYYMRLRDDCVSFVGRDINIKINSDNYIYVGGYISNTLQLITSLDRIAAMQTDVPLIFQNAELVLGSSQFPSYVEALVKHKDDDNFSEMGHVFLDNNTKFFNPDTSSFYIPLENLVSEDLAVGDTLQIYYCWTIYDNLGNAHVYSYYNNIVRTVAYEYGSSFIDTNENVDDNISNSIDYTNSIRESTDAINNQTEAIREGNETNKNIFQKLGDILGFINPFSENFFGRKLVELIIDGLKSLFIPEDGFFSDFFEEIRQWFSDRLGFLWAPFDFFIELLTRILNINFSEPKFTIPDIHEPFTNNKIVSSTEFNFNDLLTNNIIKTVHDIYLLLVDGFIIFSLYKLTREKIEEVFTK